MKIVCDACQAKYSIADEKIQGKAFKIRCKKCNHIIVVRVGADGAVATSGAAATDKARSSSHQAAQPAASAKATPAGGSSEQGAWHVVIDGEQVGPLTESEIKDKLHQGKVNSDTLVWKEGFGDWTQFSAVPELTPLLARTTHHPVAAAKPARTSASRAAVSAPAAASPSAAPDAAADDPFAAPTVISPAGTADLFAGAAAAPAAAATPGVAASAPSPAPTSPFLFGGAASAPAAEPIITVRNPGGNGAGTTHLTGQRNENSVLFSLANLEALAVPSQSPGVRTPSSTGNTEGSGLIDIRSMAAMTLSDGTASENRRSADALPTFSTPQFSPVAPVILPLSTSGPPKWVYPVLGMLAIAITAVGVAIYMVANKPPPGLAPPPPPPAPIAAPAAPPGATPAPPASGEPAKAATDEKGTAQATEAKAEKPKGKGEKKVHKADQSSGKGAGDEGAGKGPGGKKDKSLDSLLGEVGAKKAGGGDEAAAKPQIKLITLSQSDIVTAMKGVQPKVQACANQFKAPGTAMASISVAAGGRVSAATVTGKFAGSPSGSCVEAAAKSARFPPCQAMTFPWPFTLSPH